MESAAAGKATALAADETETLVTFTVAGQGFGIPVSRVRDILVPERIAPVPLAPPAVAGLINLRGRIVTVIDVRTRLGLAPRQDDERPMGVTVGHRGESYTLLVDRVGDIITLPAHLLEEKPALLAAAWRETTAGVFRLDEGLLVVLDVDRILDVE